MAPTIPIATHNMAALIEVEPLTLYLFNTFIVPNTEEILQCKYLIQAKGKNNRALKKTYYQNNLEDLQIDWQGN